MKIVLIIAFIPLIIWYLRTKEHREFRIVKSAWRDSRRYEIQQAYGIGPFKHWIFLRKTPHHSYGNFTYDGIDIKGEYPLGGFESAEEANDFIREILDNKVIKTYKE